MKRPKYTVSVVFSNSKKNITKRSCNFQWAVSDLMSYKHEALKGWVYKDGKIVAELDGGKYKFVG